MAPTLMQGGEPQSSTQLSSTAVAKRASSTRGSQR